MSEKATPDVPFEPTADVWVNPDLLVQLLNHELDTGYKLVTFYTACATAYATLAGLAAKDYFESFAEYRAVALYIAAFGLLLGLMSLFAPWGLEISRRDIAMKANRYAAALGLPPERFVIVRVRIWTSGALFVAIACAWVFLLVRALSEGLIYASPRRPFSERSAGRAGLCLL